MRILPLICLASIVACSSSSPGTKEAPVPPPVSSDIPTPEPTDTSTPPPASVPDASVPASDAALPPSDASVLDAALPPPANLTSCLASCEAKYPIAASENTQLDSTCMLGACGTVCNDLGTPGKNFLPNVDAGVCDTNAVDSFAISTPSEACSTCLASTPTCCSQWIALFGSKDGKGLSTCSNTCYSTYKK